MNETIPGTLPTGIGFVVNFLNNKDIFVLKANSSLKTFRKMHTLTCGGTVKPILPSPPHPCLMISHRIRIRAEILVCNKQTKSPVSSSQKKKKKKKRKRMMEDFNPKNEVHTIREDQ